MQPDPIVTGEAEGPPTQSELRDQQIAGPPTDPVEGAALDPSAPFIDQTVAQAPAATGEVVSGAPAAPATIDEARRQSFAASQGGIASAEDRANVQRDVDDVEQQRLQAVADDERDRGIDRAAYEQAAKDARDEYLKKVEEAEGRVKDFKFHDHYADQSTARKVVNGFSVFLGGLGNLGGQAPGSPNLVMQKLERDVERDHDEQLNYLKSAEWVADRKREGYKNLLDQQRDERHQAELDYANKKVATANQFAQLAQTARGKQNYDSAMIEVAKMKKSALDDQGKVFAEIAKEHLEDARAQAALLKAKHRGAGSGNATGAADLADWLKANPTASEGDQIRAAAKYHIPERGKAGVTSLETIKADVARGSAPSRGQVSADKLIVDQASKWAKDNHIPELIKKQDELGAVIEELHSAPHNPLEQALAVERAVSSARGGAASKQALALALNHLGPKFTSIEDVKRAIYSKEIGEKQMNNFVGFLTNQLGTAQGEGKKKFDEFDKFIGSQPEAQRPAFESQRGRVFSGLSGFGGDSNPAPSQAAQKTIGRLQSLGAVPLE